MISFASKTLPLLAALLLLCSLALAAPQVDRRPLTRPAIPADRRPLTRPTPGVGPQPLHRPARASPTTDDTFDIKPVRPAVQPIVPAPGPASPRPKRTPQRRPLGPPPGPPGPGHVYPQPPVRPNTPRPAVRPDPSRPQHGSFQG